MSKGRAREVWRMPIYEYRCGGCGELFETLQKSTEPARGAACPRCGSKRTRRLFSRFGFTSGSVVRSSTGSGGCAACRPSPGQCGTCGGH
ncbi:MAG: zinc ribbon domain-containing protein [Candidatus Aureabacteria bacterium]|nr:zinc ribbon domain-containing protein [Candidatus Auribacterota bacterium]